jgi:hypothetical protein
MKLQLDTAISIDLGRCQQMVMMTNIITAVKIKANKSNCLTILRASKEIIE